VEPGGWRKCVGDFSESEVAPVGDRLSRAPEYARMLLAAIRILNGVLALVAPQVLARRVGIDPDRSSASLYFMRMFGVRTIFIGADLLLKKGDARAETVRTAAFIHGSDTLSAALAALSGQLPRGAGLMITAISAVNTGLALYARRGNK